MKKTLFLAAVIAIAVPCIASADTVVVVSESSINAGSGDPNGVATKESTAEYGFRPTQPKIDVWVAGKKCSLNSSAMGSVPMGCNYTIAVNAKGEISGELRAGNAVCTQTADIARACG